MQPLPSTVRAMPVSWLFLLHHLLAGPALGSPLIRLAASGGSTGVGFASNRVLGSREAANGPSQSQSAPQLFTKFKRPGPDEVLVTGTDVDVVWLTSSSYNGTVVLELGEASGDAPLRSFVHTEYDVPFQQANYTLSIPENLEPGSYALRIAQSTSPTTFVDSPIFSIIYAAPPPSSSGTPPATTSTDQAASLPPHPSGGISEGQKIGIGTGVALSLLLVLGGFLIWRQTKRHHHRQHHAAGSSSLYGPDAAAGSSRVGATGRGLSVSTDRGSSSGGGGGGGARSIGGLGSIRQYNWGNASPRTVVASSGGANGAAAGPVPLEDEYKLPEGVTSAYDMATRQAEPIELPADVYMFPESSPVSLDNEDGDDKRGMQGETATARGRGHSPTSSRSSPSSSHNPVDESPVRPPPSTTANAATADEIHDAGRGRRLEPATTTRLAIPTAQPRNDSTPGLRTEWRESFLPENDVDEQRQSSDLYYCSSNYEDDGNTDGSGRRRESDATAVYVSPIETSVGNLGSRDGGRGSEERRHR